MFFICSTRQEISRKCLHKIHLFIQFLNIFEYFEVEERSSFTLDHKTHGKSEKSNFGAWETAPLNVQIFFFFLV